MAENTKDFQNLLREKISDTYFNFFSVINFVLPKSDERV